ncbi:MAG: putative ABC transport system permease protein [Roseivirga sp.]|jgi:putative ABC transport system permease protein
MISFFKNGFRTIKREKFFTLINLIGLSIGMFCFLVTALYVRDEVTYDRWHKNADNIYMSALELKKEDGASINIRPSDALMYAMKDESPAVLDVVSISRNSYANYKVNDEWVQTDKLFFSSPSLFKVFDFDLKFGNEELALTDPSDIILSSAMAETLFPGINPVGETIAFQNKGSFKVAGVLNPIPKNSHLKFEFLGSVASEISNYDYNKDNWLNGSGFSYFQLKEGHSPDQLIADAKQILSLHDVTEVAEGLAFLKFSDLYLTGQTERYDPKNLFGGQSKYLYIFSLVGGLILFVACFNYINLTTALSFSKVKQMGIRKIMGASRSRLVLSQMVETFALSFCALIVAIIGLELVLPYTQSLIGKELDINFSQAPQLLLLPVSVLLLVVLISGIYPAVSLSSFSISGVLRGVMPQSKVNILRESLFVLQFVICTGLLITALVIRGQSNYLIELDKGYNEENIMNLSLYQEGRSLDYRTVRNALEAIPEIEKVTSSPLPMFAPPPPMMILVDGKLVPITIYSGGADQDFNELFEIEVLEGTDFTNLPKSQLDSVVIINETAKKKLALNPAIGSKMPNGETVVGVVKDFHFSSAKNVIEPAMIYYTTNPRGSVQFKYRANNKEAVKAQVGLALNKLGVKADPGLKELEGFFTAAYEKESRLITIFDFLTVMVVSVAFLGLFALSSFENKLREKEIGIRKVLGATYLNLIQTLNKRFTWLIVLAISMAVPITKYGVEQWLSDFPYRQDSLNIYFISAIVIVGFIAFSVLGLHSYFSAQKNPVDVLRSE